MLCDHNIGQAHLRSPGKKGQTKNSGFRAVIHVFRLDSAKNAKNYHKILEESKSVKINSENRGKFPKWGEKCLFLKCFMSYLSHF